MGAMKKTTFCRLVAIGGLSLGGLSQPLLADGPDDLEALAEKARQAAEDTTQLKKGKKAEAQKSETKKSEAEPTEPRKAPKVEAKVAEPQEAAPPKEVKPIDLKKRAEKLGLVSGLRKDVSAVTTFTNGERLWNEVEESELGKVFLDLLAENDVDLEDADSPGAKIASLFAEEFLIAVGEGTAKQAGNLLKLNNLNDKYQTALMVRVWSMGMGNEEAMMESGPFGSLMEAIRENPDFLVNLIASSEMPPILIASRISDEGQRDEVAALLEMGAGMALEFGAEQMPFLDGIESEVGGIAFSGLSIDGEGLLNSLQEEMNLQEALSEIIDPAGAQDLVNSLRKKDLVFMSGISDDAVYLFLGSRPEDIPLAANASESLVNSEAFAFVDPYLDEAIVNLLWMEEDLVKSSSAQPVLGSYIEGLRLGLKGNASLGNTKPLRRMLTKLQKLEVAYLAANQFRAAASISFLRADGLHSESFGGIVEAGYDWTTPHQLGNVDSDSFLTVQMAYQREAGELETEYVETAFATAYEMVSLMSAMEESPAEFDEFLQGFDLFDTKMKKDALTLWKGLRLSEEGLGLENIFEIDLAGTWPTVPGVPESIIKDGLAPRLSIVTPVTDRAKLASSWEQIEEAAGALLKTASEMAGEKIPMQKPMSSQNDGLKTWFFPIPMQTDDFVPSVTLDDRLMVMSTSKERAVALAQAAKSKTSGQTGVVVEMKFQPLQAFLTNWLALVKENPEEILTDNDLLEFYQENQETLEAIVASLKEFDSWSSHTRMEDGQLRSSSHFKTR